MARAALLDITDARGGAGMDVYLLSAIRPARLVAPIMAQGGGAIVNISTACAFEPPK